MYRNEVRARAKVIKLHLSVDLRWTNKDQGIMEDRHWVRGPHRCLCLVMLEDRLGMLWQGDPRRMLPVARPMHVPLHLMGKVELLQT
jgi:hypothetical protein